MAKGHQNLATQKKSSGIKSKLDIIKKMTHQQISDIPFMIYFLNIKYFVQKKSTTIVKTKFVTTTKIKLKIFTYKKKLY